jgi:hypothetical protein
MSDPSTFTITTLRAQQGNLVPDSPVLQLRGRALPHQPFTLEGTMRADLTWYPGNAVASIQMLGAEEKPTSVAGAWKDKFIRSTTDEGTEVSPAGVALYDGQQVRDVFELCLAVEEIRLGGQLVRVEWDSFVREGILHRFKQTWKRREDVEWEMEFMWISRGEPQSPVTLPASASTDAFSKELRADTDNLQEAAILPDFAVLEEFAAAIDSAVSDIEDAVLEVENGVKNVLAQVTSPLDAAERALAATETVATAASSIVTACEQFPALVLYKTQNVFGGAGSTSNLDADDLAFQEALVATNYQRGLKTAARTLQLTAVRQADTLRSQARSTALLASFLARAPTDLRDISQTYYGTPDEWRRLRAYNNFNSSKVEAGTLVLVPKLTFADDRT